MSEEEKPSWLWRREVAQLRQQLTEAQRDVWEQAAQLAETCDYGPMSSPLDSVEVRMRTRIALQCRAKAVTAVPAPP